MVDRAMAVDEGGAADWLTGDGGRTARAWLEFTPSAGTDTSHVVNLRTVPSQAKLSRYWNLVPHEAQARSRVHALTRIRDEALALPKSRRPH